MKRFWPLKGFKAMPSQRVNKERYDRIRADSDSERKQGEVHGPTHDYDAGESGDHRHSGLYVGPYEGVPSAPTASGRV